MSEDLSQKISQFLDDDLSHDEAMHLLQKIRSQPELQGKLNRFEAISHALKTGDYVSSQSGFTEAVRVQIQQEPVYFLPQHKPRKQAYKHFAMAASLLLAAIVAAGYGLKGPTGDAGLATQASALKQAPVVPVVAQNQPVLVAKQVEQRPLNTRINDYLQAHKSSVYANEDNQYKPLARVTAYSQK